MHLRERFAALEQEQHRLRHLDAAQRSLAHLVAIDDLPGDRKVLRRDYRDLVDAGAGFDAAQ